MVHIRIPKQKCRILRRTGNFPAINALTSLRLGLLVSTIFATTINAVQVDAIECGTVSLYRQAVLGGNEVLKDEWPFIAALYYSRTLKYFCGGTIISTKHVLTAAHCMQAKGKAVPLASDAVIVRLGAYNLTDRSEKDAMDRNVTHIFVHNDWAYNEDKYNADIAILVLNEKLTFSDHIRPVCMPPANFLIDGLVGTVVGWGETENRSAEGIPRKIEINAMNDTYCYDTDDGIARFASERSFCGEGSGSPNYGDSGGGFFAVVGSGWVQFGTVSFVRPKATGNSLNIALYMKLTSLRDWITEKVEQTGGNISLAKTKVDLNCTYGHNSDGAYGCSLFNLNIRQENFVVEKFTGFHEKDKDNESVEMILFGASVMVSLPRNFGNIFRNLKLLTITVNTRRIYRSSLENLERLESIRFTNSNIVELDGNSLWNLPNLQTLLLERSELKFLDASTFSRNYKLKKVEIYRNPLRSLPQNLFHNNLLLETVSIEENSIEIIDENIFETNANLRMVSLKGNRLRHLSENWFRNNFELRIIDLSDNRIRTVDEGTFRANFKLTALYLGSNEIEFLPEQLLQGVESLKAIYLEKNSIKAIYEHFFETNGRIQKIFLESNQLTHIPVNLFRNNTKLSSLDLGENFIEEIDENLFEKNALLQRVSLESNLLAEFPVGLFRHNPLLDLVILAWNLPQKINERLFEWNARLQDVNFYNNYAGSFPTEIFHNNSLLETVRLNANLMQSIDEHIFQNNANLREIYLDANMLKHLPEKLFHNNPLLQIVDLSLNYFTTLHVNTFNTNAYLNEVFIQECKLETLPRNLFAGNIRLKYIDLHRNKLKFIETDFSVIENVSLINLSGNVCIDAIFHDGGSHTYSSGSKSRKTRNLINFQFAVVVYCTGPRGPEND